FFKYDFGGTGWYNSYTLFNTFGGGISILAMMILFPILRKFLNCIKIFFLSLFMAVAGYAVLLGLAFVNMSNVFLLFIPGFLIFAANGMLTVLTTIFLANTVDYGQVKNNRRDESVIFSMQTFVVKLASGVAAFIAAVALNFLSLSDKAVTEAEQTFDFSSTVELATKIGLRMIMTILPVILLFVAVLYFRKNYKLTDEKLEEINNQLKNN
ncbi:MAG: MFS transporter, partial [Lachnospiraceae bacterium]|nr:MFS transporter [Lachnospiraceae bacterium]